MCRVGEYQREFYVSKSERFNPDSDRCLPDSAWAADGTTTGYNLVAGAIIDPLLQPNEWYLIGFEFPDKTVDTYTVTLDKNDGSTPAVIDIAVPNDDIGASVTKSIDLQFVDVSTPLTMSIVGKDGLGSKIGDTMSLELFWTGNVQ